MWWPKNPFPVPDGISRTFAYPLLGATILFAPVPIKAASPGCAPAPAGLVSWWQGENSTTDAVGGNNGTIAGSGTVTYGPGVVGQAFVFDGTHRDRIDLGNPVNLQLQDFTLEAWIKRSNPTVTAFDILGADGSVCGDGACIIGYGRGGYILAVANDGRLILSRTDIDGVITTQLITDTNWHHVAVTKAGTNAVFYVDGQPQATPPYVPHEPYTFDDATCSCSAAIAIGSRGDARGGTFYGMIDEPAVFNRALSASEIQSIYAAGSAGMCLPHCVPAPAGLVSSWRGENSTADAVGGNNGTIAGSGTVTYGPGVVGQAFVFDGTHRDRIDLGNPVNLQLQDFTLEAWIKRSSPTVTAFDILGADGSVCGDGACIIGYGRGGYILAVANDGRLILSRTDIDGVITTQLITDTNWHHLAVTKAGTNALFYVDGQPQATPPYVPHEPYTFDDATCSCSAAIAIGSRGDARGGTFYGMIDEPAVFNRALSAGEIQSIYAAGSMGLCLNHPPVADAGATLPLVISVNDSNATAVLNGSRSSDPDGDSLQYLWFEAGAAAPIASGVVAMVTLPLGTNVLTLSVSDGFATNSQTFTVEVITTAQAVERLVALCQSSAPRPQPLIATLSAALAAIERSNPTAAINQLQAFQNKVSAQVAPLDPTLADTFIQAAQNIIDALAGGSKANGKLTLARAADGTMRLRGTALPGAVYIIETSTNLLDWIGIGVATNNGTAPFEFQDPNPSSSSTRFYRVRSP